MSTNSRTFSYQPTGTITFNWRTVASLLFLFGIPGIPAIFIVGLVILGTLSPSMMTTLINAEYYQTPLVIILHGISGVLFFFTMPFQFATRLRVKKPKFHRINGYLAFLSGCVMGASGVWMHFVFSPEKFNTTLFITIIIALAICFSFSMAISYAIKRNIRAHQRWIYFATSACLAVITPLFFEPLLPLVKALNQDLFLITRQLINDYGPMIALLLNTAFAQWLFSQHYKKAAN